MSKRLQNLLREGRRVEARLSTRREELLDKLARVHVQLAEQRKANVRYAKRLTRREVIATDLSLEGWNGVKVERRTEPVEVTEPASDPLTDLWREP